MRLQRRVVAVGSVLALCATVANCGDDSEGENNTSAEARSESGSPSSTARDSGALKLGYILPETGALAFLGPATIGAVDLAVADVNKAGGVNGKPVTVATGDEGDTDGVAANQSVDRLLQSDRVSAIIGALSSTTSMTIIGKVVGSQTVQCSPAATNPDFTNYEDDGYFFRTQASDNLLGPVFASAMINDGGIRIGYISRADDGGRNLIEVTKEAVTDLGAESVGEVFYDPTTRDFDAEVAQLAAEQPDAILVYAFDEGSALLAKMIEAGIGPKDVNIYVHSGLRDADLAEKVAPDDPSVLDGMKGVSPAATSKAAYLKRLAATGVNVDSPLFSGQAFDCTTIVALAAEAAKSNDPSAIRDQMNDVTREGTPCTSFKECKTLLGKGENIDYDGVSGPLDFTDAGEPSVGTYDIFGWNAEGVLETIDTVRTDQL